MFIQEIKFVEDFDYMANPRFVMNNSDFNERKDEWNRRCRIDIQHEIDLKCKRRLKAAKKQKKLAPTSCQGFFYPKSRYLVVVLRLTNFWKELINVAANRKILAV